MKHSTMTCLELNRSSGLALKKANKGPVILESHGKPRAVILSYKQYERLTKNPDTDKGLSLSFLNEIDDLLTKKFSSIKEAIQSKLDEIPKSFA